ncbi:NlpC/P60 family protein [Gordonia malaquae]|uniref:NlpC/P60 family protein n=1 Tax=Gordonia malaquae TaxID=410332 RepID=UPI00301A490E
MRFTSFTSTSAIAVTLAIMTIISSPAYGSPAPRNPLASLINQIGDIDEALTDMSASVATKQQHVNKTVVDFQNAVAALQIATAANDGAKASLTSIGKQVELAQRDFDNLVRTIYRQGNNRGSMAEYLASGEPEQVLERMTTLDRITADQQRTVRRLQVARNQQANRVAATGVSRAQITAAANDANERRQEALSAYETAQTAMSKQQATRADLLRQRDALSRRVAKVRGTPNRRPEPLPAPRVPAPVADGLDRAIKSIPSRPVQGDDQFAQAAEAATALAADTGQALLASLIGQREVPNSTLLDAIGIGGTSLAGPGDNNVFTRLGTGSLGSLFGGTNGAPGTIQPGIRGPQGVEVVVNRMKSQLGVPYAWGGGDANGPTLGVRDGGVADSFGDYQKVGFDCSGLMKYGFAGVGIDLPKYSGYQYTAGPQVPLSEMERGDMIFYGAGGTQHVALILGDGTMLEARESGTTVHIVPVRTDGAEPVVVRML